MTNRVLDGQKLYPVGIDAPPGKFRPESDAHVGGDHVAHRAGVVGFEDDLGRKALMPAERVADEPQLAGALQADEALVGHLLQADGFPVCIAPPGGHGHEDALRTDVFVVALLVVVLVEKPGGHAHVVQVAAGLLAHFEIHAFVIVHIFHNGVRHQ